MQKTIALFTGENHYTLTQEIQRWYQNFLGKYSDGTIHFYTPFNRNGEEILQQIYGGGLFSNHKLIILSGIPLDSTSGNTLKIEDIEMIANTILNQGIPEGTILILISYKPDKRTKCFKAFPTENIKNFPLLRESELKDFIKEKAKNGGINLENDEIIFLITSVGTDQFRLESEINKLIEYKKIHPEYHFTIDNIKDFLYFTPEQNNFEFFDMILEDKKKAYQYIETMQQEDLNWAQMLGFFHRGIKNFILLADAYEKGIKDPKILASELKIHPFVLSKNLTKIKIILEKKSYINNFLKGLIYIESNIKQGKLPEENFWLKIKTLLFEK